jgi:CHAD domain-containing protein
MGHARTEGRGKWIDADGPDHPAALVARRALGARLSVVGRYLPLAARKPEKNPEYVHQLRVATRRAIAAIDVFQELLPSRRATAMRRRLKKLRRAAGDARDLDVLLERLAQRPDELMIPDPRQVIEQLTTSRRRAQQPIVRMHNRVKGKRFARKVARLVRKVRCRRAEGTTQLFDVARTALRPLTEEFFQAGEGDLCDIARLHRLRIQGKKLRYAMELLAGAFDGSFREHLVPQIEEIQERLGAIHDLEAARILVQRWIDHIPTGSDKPLSAQIGEAYAARIEQACRSFAEWWSAERAQRLRSEIEGYLAG